MVEKVKTGIKNFDNLVDGGIPKESIVLLSGSPGTGKTIFALEFLYRGATKFDENGLYVTFEEKAEYLKTQAKQFGWDFDKYNKKISIVSIPANEISKNTVTDIYNIIKRRKIKRLVIDSLSALIINTPTMTGDLSKINDHIKQRFVYHFISDLRKKSEVTTFLISQTGDEHSLSVDGVSEYASDGIIHIVYESMGGNYSRSLSIRKMRQVKNDEDIHPLEISKNGLVVHKLD